MREDNLRATLVRKIDQKILETPESEPVVFHFREGTPQLLAHSIAKEYVVHGWKAEVRFEDGDPGVPHKEMLLVLEPDDGADGEMSPAEEQMSNCASDLRSRGAVQAHWELNSHTWSDRTIYQAKIEAVFCTSGSQSNDGEGTTGDATVRASATMKDPSAAALLCTTSMMDTLEGLFLTLSR
jgi:hypothetical protein